MRQEILNADSSKRLEDLYLLNWKADWDRYRFKLPAAGGDRENIDSLMIGAQYTFGNPR